METQIVKEYEYHGLGLPVKLTQVELVKIRGDWYPKIDVEQVALELFEHLLQKAQTTPLTGEEIEFIRIHMNLSQTQFSQFLKINRATLIRWEQAGAKVPNRPHPTRVNRNAGTLSTHSPLVRGNEEN